METLVVVTALTVLSYMLLKKAVFDEIFLSSADSKLFLLKSELFILGLNDREIQETGEFKEIKKLIRLSSKQLKTINAIMILHALYLITKTRNDYNIKDKDKFELAELHDFEVRRTEILTKFFITKFPIIIGLIFVSFFLKSLLEVLFVKFKNLNPASRPQVRLSFVSFIMLINLFVFPTNLKLTEKHGSFISETL